MEKDASVKDRFIRMESVCPFFGLNKCARTPDSFPFFSFSSFVKFSFTQMFKHEGCKRTVDAILLVHDHHHPHILLLQIGNSFWKMCDVCPPFSPSIFWLVACMALTPLLFT
jgi:hypothetical protein